VQHKLLLKGFLNFVNRYFSKVVEPKGKRWSERLNDERKAILILRIGRSAVYDLLNIKAIEVKIDMIKC
jgi:hypothetical protein